jgi:DNA-binding response OmpR family regulator
MNATAIVIDDDQNIVDTFCEYLETLGIKVFGYGYDGNDAVKLYEEHSPNIVFLDLMMPNYDGFYALERIRIINPMSKIILITGAMLDEPTTRLLSELKPSAIITKPYDPKVLPEIIKKVLN